MKIQPPVKYETGLLWSESLPRFLGGSININLYNNQIGFYAGQTIYGSVDIEIAEEFRASSLVLELAGYERGFFEKQGKEVLDFHREMKEIISIKVTLAEYEKDMHLKTGQYTYSFEVKLPRWLPETTLLKTKTERFQTEYTLRAQFTPTNPAGYAHDLRFPGKFEKVSLFRGSRTVHIYKLYEEIPPQKITLSLKSNVGSFGIKLFGA